MAAGDPQVLLCLTPMGSEPLQEALAEGTGPWQLIYASPSLIYSSPSQRGAVGPSCDSLCGEAVPVLGLVPAFSTCSPGPALMCDKGPGAQVALPAAPSGQPHCINPHQ